MVHVLTLTDDDVTGAVAWYADLFGAVEIGRECLLDGYVLSADIAFAGHVLTLTGFPEPSDVPGDVLPLSIEHDDARGLVARMRRHGARLVPSAGGAGVLVSDPFGQRWLVVEHP
ncbi:VOC family protein [Actinoplanes sp. NPDC051343]|uniref:VOC family protein n=1 Tax=Actinoplanes sp. NPDC051343 TaxID=3363906 RepID=UPI0037B21DDD